MVFVWDLMPELTITSPYVHSRVDSNIFTVGPGPACVRVDFIPQSGTLDLASNSNSIVKLPDAIAENNFKETLSKTLDIKRLD
jgi:hypothetical protein